MPDRDAQTPRWAVEILSSRGRITVLNLRGRVLRFSRQNARIRLSAIRYPRRRRL
jgi:hypothetical protein